MEDSDLQAKGGEGPEKPRREPTQDEARKDEQRAARAEGFSRRALLEAGWTVPVLATMSSVFGNASKEPASGKDADGKEKTIDHSDVSTHSDTNHVDGNHGDVTFGHLDTLHQDSGHTDITVPHNDTAHGDSNPANHTDAGTHDDVVGSHSDSGHGDGSSHTDGSNHSDLGHGDYIEHLDTGHHDLPHFDQTLHSDSIIIHWHGDSNHTDETGTEFIDKTDAQPVP